MITNDHFYFIPPKKKNMGVYVCLESSKFQDFSGETRPNLENLRTIFATQLIRAHKNINYFRSILMGIGQNKSFIFG